MNKVSCPLPALRITGSRQWVCVCIKCVQMNYDPSLISQLHEFKWITFLHETILSWRRRWVPGCSSALHSQSGPDKSFRNMIPPYVCSCAVRGFWSFYGNQVLSWMKTRGKQTKMTKWGVMLDSIQAQLWYYPNQSKFGLAKFECEGRRSATALPGCWMHPIPGVSNHTDLFLATGIPK